MFYSPTTFYLQPKDLILKLMQFSDFLSPIGINQTPFGCEGQDLRINPAAGWGHKCLIWLSETWRYISSKWSCKIIYSMWKVSVNGGVHNSAPFSKWEHNKIQGFSTLLINTLFLKNIGDFFVIYQKRVAT